MDRGTINRRHALCCGAAAVGGLFTSLVDAAEADAAPPHAIPASAQALVDATFDGLDTAQLWDLHTHLLGTGDAGSGCSVHPHLDSWWHPLEAARKRVILHGAGVAQGSRSVDRDYVQRLAALAADFPSGARWMLFAFDHAHDEQGASDPRAPPFTCRMPGLPMWRARTTTASAGWQRSIFRPHRDRDGRLGVCVAATLGARHGPRDRAMTATVARQQNKALQSSQEESP